MMRTIPFYQFLIGKGTTSEVLLYGLVEVLSYEKGFCYASNKYLAEQIGIKENSLPVILSSIKKKGWIQTKFDEKGRRQAIIPNLVIEDEGLIHIKGGFNEDLRGGLIHIKQIIKKDNIVDKYNSNNKDKSLLLECETSLSDNVENSKSYGNEQINEAFTLWEEMTGLEQKNSQKNRRSAYNLVRSKGLEWIENSLKILLVAKSSSFVRKEVSGIANFNDLEQNWEYLWDWGRQKASKKAKTIVSTKI